MSTHNICLYKEVDKNYTGCNLKTTKLLDCALIGVCAVISSNMVILYFSESELLSKKKKVFRKDLVFQATSLKNIKDMTRGPRATGCSPE